MKAIKIMSTIVMIYFMAVQPTLAQSTSFKGQLSTWATWNDNEAMDNQLGIRYIPELSLSRQISRAYSLDGEFSVNAYRSWEGKSINTINTRGVLDPYRVWLRFSTEQLEIRLGLQKINFGSATLMRPLMWFDRIDPRDPLQLTDGVYGVLLRYYFLNNANIWLWGLYGNEETKGWEFIPTKEKSGEFGGRIQYPISTGEIAFTFHHRQLGEVSGLLPGISLTGNNAAEDRFAVDGKWDLSLGIWFEGAVVHQLNTSPLLPDYQHMLNVGADYTFNIGNGLYLLSEYFVYSMGDELLQQDEQHRLSAFMTSYPLTMLDKAYGIFYYDWENEDVYRMLRYERAYDNWSFHLIGFWNPDQNRLFRTTTQSNYFSGKGLQFMIVFNH